jgi:hypothetical protein
MRSTTMARDTQTEVTVGQFMEANRLVAADWPADDPRWDALRVMLDYSIQFGERRVWDEII